MKALEVLFALLPIAALETLAKRWMEHPARLRLLAEAAYRRAAVARLLKLPVDGLQRLGYSLHKWGSPVIEMLQRRDALLEQQRAARTYLPEQPYSVWMVSPITGDKTLVGTLPDRRGYSVLDRLQALCSRLSWSITLPESITVYGQHYYVGTEQISGLDVWITRASPGWFVTVSCSPAEAYADCCRLFASRADAEDFVQLERAALSASSSITLETADEPVLHCESEGYGCEGELELESNVELILHPIIDGGQPVAYCRLCAEIAFQDEAVEEVQLVSSSRLTEHMSKIQTDVIRDGHYVSGLAYIRTADAPVQLTPALAALEPYLQAACTLEPGLQAVYEDGETVRLPV